MLNTIITQSYNNELVSVLCLFVFVPVCRFVCYLDVQHLQHKLSWKVAVVHRPTIDICDTAEYKMLARKVRGC